MRSLPQEVVADEERDGEYTGHYGIGLIPCIPPDYVLTDCTKWSRCCRPFQQKFAIDMQSSN